MQGGEEIMNKKRRGKERRGEKERGDKVRNQENEEEA